MSTEGAPAFTAADGTAKVETDVVGAQWIAVSKPGYEREQVGMPAKWPLRVVLKKETQKP
jgi:hypothetical protein